MLRQASERGNPFALVLTDCHMPEMDGFDLASRIRNSPHLTEAVVMMLSSGMQSGDSQRCRDLGICTHVTKPVRRAELKTAISKAMAPARKPAPAAPAVSDLEAPAGVPDEPAGRCFHAHSCWWKTIWSTSAWRCASSRNEVIA